MRVHQRWPFVAPGQAQARRRTVSERPQDRREPRRAQPRSRAADSGARDPTVRRSRMTLAEFTEEDWWPGYAVPNLAEDTPVGTSSCSE